METRRRSIAKALTWRFLALVITALVAYALTGSLGIALEIGLADTLIKFGAYYGHERLWVRITYGRPRPPEYQI